MASVVGDADLVRTGPGRILLAPVGTALPTDFNAALDAAFVEVGFTTSGSTLGITQDRLPVRVAERLREIRNQAGASSMVFSFTMVQISPANLARVIAGGTTITGTGANGYGADTTVFIFPKTTGSQRYSLVHESEDGRERTVLARCFITAAGDLVNNPVDSADPRGLPIEAAVEENSDATLGGGNDAYMLFDTTLL